MEQFLDALPDSDMRIRIKQARSRDLNDAIKHAVELEAYLRAEDKRGYRAYQHQLMTDTTAGEESVKIELKDWMASIEKNVADMKKEIQQLRKGEGPSDRKPFKYSPGPGKAMDAVKCYGCYKRGHYKKNCPEKVKSTQGNKTSEERDTVKKYEYKGSNGHLSGRLGSCSHEAGMFIYVMINGVKVKMLVDTGAIVTMVSTASIKAIKDYCEIQVKEPGMKVFTADGDELAVEGKVSVETEIGNHLVMTLALVADLQVEGILGLDMIKNLGMIIDAKQSILSFNDDRIPLVWEGKFGCFRVVAMDKDNGPPRSELIASEKICTLKKGQSHSHGTAQSTWREDASDQYTTANGHLVENKAAVELFKVKADSKVVYQNTEIGQNVE